MKNSNQILKPLAFQSAWAFLFTWKKTVGIVQTAWRVLLRKVLMWNTYTSCYDLPRERYIVCACEQILTPLKKTPLWTPKWLLKECYEQLMEEYALLSNNKEIEFQRIKTNEVAKLQEKILLLNLCYNGLIGFYNTKQPIDIFLEFLTNQGITGIDTLDLIKKVEGRIKNSTFQLKELISQLKTEKQDTGIVTRADYESIAIILEKNGYRLGKSTANFIIALNLQRKEQQEQEKQLNTKK